MGDTAAWAVGDVDPEAVRLDAGEGEAHTASNVLVQGVVALLQAVQSLQPAEPGAALNLPAPHAVHTEDVDAASKLPKLPAAHAVHAEEPVASELYAPATHTVHTADVEAVGTPPNAPAEQAVHNDVPAASVLYAPAAHAVHTADEVAPTRRA